MSRAGYSSRECTGRARRAAAALLLAALVLPGRAGAAPAAFELLTVPGPGRTAFAEIVDLDGDGRGDLVTASFTRLPPEQRRVLRVHFQREDGSLAVKPDWTAPLPEGAAAYDYYRAPNGADELLFMRRDRVTRLSLAGRVPVWRDVALPGTTLAVAPDERGIDRLRLLRSELAGGPLLVVPGFGEIFISTLEGEARGRLLTQSRANFFVPPRPGLLVIDNEVDLYFEHPRIDTGDVDGDGRADLVISNRHELLVFRSREAGGFAAKPDQRHQLKRLSETDLVRATGAARVDVRDWNGDGRADLLVAYTRGGLLNAQTNTTLHVNRAGSWNLKQADQSFAIDGGWAATSFEDVDGDAKLEFVEVRLSLQTLELVEILLTRSIDPTLVIHRPAQATPFEAEPAFERSLALGVNFETQRTVGFLPALQDLNSDGRLDLIAPSDGKQLEVHLGAPGPALASDAIRQAFDTTGVIRFGDLDRNGLLDFVLHDPSRPGTPIRIGVNQGTLPGTRSVPELRATTGRAKPPAGATKPLAGSRLGVRGAALRGAAEAAPGEDQRADHEDSDEEEQPEILLSRRHAHERQREQRADEREAPVEVHAGEETAEREQQQRIEAGRELRIRARVPDREVEQHGAADREPVQHLAQHQLAAGRAGLLGASPGGDGAQHTVDRDQRHPVLAREGRAGRRERDAHQREQHHAQRDRAGGLPGGVEGKCAPRHAGGEGRQSLAHGRFDSRSPSPPPATPEGMPPRASQRDAAARRGTSRGGGAARQPESGKSRRQRAGSMRNPAFIRLFISRERSSAVTRLTKSAP